MLASRARIGKSEPMALILQLNKTSRIRMPINDFVLSIRVCQPKRQKGAANKQTTANAVTVAKTALPNMRLGSESPIRIAKKIEWLDLKRLRDGEFMFMETLAVSETRKFFSCFFIVYGYSIVET